MLLLNKGMQSQSCFNNASFDITPPMTGPMYPVPNQEDPQKGCVDLSYDDSGCAKLNQCCVGIHNFGDHQKCTSTVRRCRKLGNGWDAPRSLTPLPGEYFYTDAPGYTTTGQFIENFDGAIGKLTSLFNLQCILKNVAFGVILTMFLFTYSGRELNYREIFMISAVASVVKCVLGEL